MATARAALGTKLVASRNLDLKWSLTLRVVAVALVCFLAATALALYGTYNGLRQANETVADLVVKQLRVQLFRIELNIDAPARFPDWDPVIDHVQRAGQCIRYVRPDSGVGRSSCVGVDHGDQLPAWVSALGTWMLGGHADIVRPISYHGKDYGALVVTTDTAVVLAAIWRDVSGLLGLTALVVVAICVLQFIAIGRALHRYRRPSWRSSHRSRKARRPDSHRWEPWRSRRSCSNRIVRPRHARNRPSGIQQGEWQGIAASGRNVTWTVIIIGRFAGGKLVEDWVELGPARPLPAARMHSDRIVVGQELRSRPRPLSLRSD